ncbi:MAG: hypothetical protein WCK16_01005 [Candidatus Moraniibacteriota bacterium]
MNPGRVSVKFSIIIANNMHKNRTFFSEEWDFTIGRYSFHRINEDEVTASFSFYAVLKEYDEQNRLIDECPSEYLPEFQEFEEEIKTVLDLLSLEVGRGIKIKDESFFFSSATCGDSEINNNHPINPSKTGGLYNRLSIPNSENDKKVKIALRLYRQSVSTNDPREQIARLYSALEQLFFDGGNKMLNVEEVGQIRGAIETLSIPSEKKKVIVDRLCNLRKSPKTMIIENIELMYENEIISEEEKKKLVGTWNKYRSAISHGEIISKRDEEFDYVVAEIDTIVEAILKRSIAHRMQEGI